TPFFGDASRVNGLLVGVTGDVERMIPVVQRLIQGTMATPVYARVQPYQELLDPQLRPWRLGATLFVVFGALALGIAAMGLAGVVSYVVTQRTREIGLRLALGGTGCRIGRSVVLTALRMVGAGLARSASEPDARAACRLITPVSWTGCPREARCGATSPRTSRRRATRDIPGNERRTAWRSPVGRCGNR